MDATEIIEIRAGNFLRKDKMKKHPVHWLPAIESLKGLCQSLAMLDAILSPEWEYRYYSFDARWGRKEMMASMRNGQGDEYFVLFNSVGAIIKGFDHESSMSPYANTPPRVWPGVLDTVPNDFHDFLKDPAFALENTTFCLWRRYKDASWQIGNISYPDESDPDGAKYLLSGLDGKPATYRKFAEEYYENDIPLSSVRHVYKHSLLTNKIVASLNSELSLTDLKTDIKKIGYPKP